MKQETPRCFLETESTTKVPLKPSRLGLGTALNHLVNKPLGLFPHRLWARTGEAVTANETSSSFSHVRQGSLR